MWGGVQTASCLQEGPVAYPVDPAGGPLPRRGRGSRAAEGALQSESLFALLLAAFARAAMVEATPPQAVPAGVSPSEGEGASEGFSTGGAVGGGIPARSPTGAGADGSRAGTLAGFAPLGDDSPTPAAAATGRAVTLPAIPPGQEGASAPALEAAGGLEALPHRPVVPAGSPVSRGGTPQPETQPDAAAPGSDSVSSTEGEAGLSRRAGVPRAAVGDRPPAPEGAATLPPAGRLAVGLIQGSVAGAAGHSAAGQGELDPGDLRPGGPADLAAPPGVGPGEVDNRSPGLAGMTLPSARPDGISPVPAPAGGQAGTGQATTGPGDAFAGAPGRQSLEISAAHPEGRERAIPGYEQGGGSSSSGGKEVPPPPTPPAAGEQASRSESEPARVPMAAAEGQGSGGPPSVTPVSTHGPAPRLATDQPQWVAELSGWLRQATVEHRGDALRIHLHPEALGELRVGLRQGADGLTVHFTAQTAPAAALLQAHLDELRRSLEGWGLNVAQLQVEVHDDGRSPESGGFGRPARERRRLDGPGEPRTLGERSWVPHGSGHLNLWA